MLLSEEFVADNVKVLSADVAVDAGSRLALLSAKSFDVSNRTSL